MEIQPYVWWLGLALITVVSTPMLGGHLFLLDSTLSAVLLAFLTWLFPGIPLIAQVTIFLFATLLLMPTVSWVAGRLTEALRVNLVAGASDYKGRIGVIETRGSGVGVRLGSETFPVRAIDHEPLRPGQRVRVKEFQGITAVVCGFGDSAKRAPEDYSVKPKTNGPSSRSRQNATAIARKLSRKPARTMPPSRICS